MVVLPYRPQKARRRGWPENSAEQPAAPCPPYDLPLHEATISEAKSVPYSPPLKRISFEDFPAVASDVLDPGEMVLDPAEICISTALRRKKQFSVASGSSVGSSSLGSAAAKELRWQELLGSGRGSAVGSTAARSRSSHGTGSYSSRGPRSGSGAIDIVAPGKGQSQGSGPGSRNQESWKRKDVFPQQPLGIPDFIQGKQPAREQQLFSSTGAQEIGWSQGVGEVWSSYGRRWTRAKPPKELSDFALAYRCSAGKHPYEAPPFSTGRFKV